MTLRSYFEWYRDRWSYVLRHPIHAFEMRAFGWTQVRMPDSVGPVGPLAREARRLQCAVIGHRFAGRRVPLGFILAIGTPFAARLDVHCERCGLTGASPEAETPAASVETPPERPNG